MSGRFISFEGGEGSGKSTQVALLEGAFKKSGKAFVVTREPGGSANAEKIRALLVSGNHEAFDPLTETLLFYAARCEHVSKKIKPALAQHTHVLCDRFADSTLVYQGIAKNLGEQYIRSLHSLLLGDFAPNLTFILDIDPTQGLARAKLRKGSETRFEELDIDFHHKVRAGFFRVAALEPQRCVVLDADMDKDALHKHIIQAIHERLGLVL